MLFRHLLRALAAPRSTTSVTTSPARAPAETITAALPRPLLPAAGVALTPRERHEIRQWLASPTTQRVLALLEARHPGLRTAGITKHARSKWDGAAAINFLNRIAGWEAYRDTLLALPEPPVTTSAPSETYPSVG